MNIESKIKHKHKKIEYKGLIEQPCNYIIPYSLAHITQFHTLTMYSEYKESSIRD